MAGYEGTLPSLRIVGGHVHLANAGVSVQIGAMSRVAIDVTIEVILAETVSKWLQDNKAWFGSAEAQRLFDDFAAGFMARGILGAFGFIVGNGDYDHYQSVEDVTVKASSLNQARFFDSLGALRKTKVRLTAELEVRGTSMKPTVASVFARVAKLYFADGSVLMFVDLTGPVAADPSGDTSGVHTPYTQKLQLTPLE
ncbi:MAG: hypothetical protein QF898_19155 [SAR202 cluster bacterium]|jgi:hypothetical protein|nr:hypothetical protein [SAR202 cluster bacterium]MDP6715800.1 hypothetical protein [SAR202 cluster bacterium]